MPQSCRSREELSNENDSEEDIEYGICRSARATSIQYWYSSSLIPAQIMEHEVVLCRPPVERDYPHAVSIVGQHPLYDRLPIRHGPRPPRVPQGNGYPHEGTVDRDGLLARSNRLGAARPLNGTVPRGLTLNWANSSKLTPRVACLVIMFRNRPFTTN